MCVALLGAWEIQEMVTFPLALLLWGCDINKGVQFHCDQLLSGQVLVKQDIWEIFGTSQWPFKPARDDRTPSSRMELEVPTATVQTSLQAKVELDSDLGMLHIICQCLPMTTELSSPPRLGSCLSVQMCCVGYSLCELLGVGLLFFFLASWAAYCNSCLIYWPQSGKHSSLLGFT